MTLSAAKDAPITAQLVGFVRLLRANGFAPGLREAQDAVRIAEADDLVRPQLLRYGLRALLCSCEHDWRRFDELYDLHWFGVGRHQAKVSAGRANRRQDHRSGPLIDARFGPADRVDRDGDATDAVPEGRGGGASSAISLAETDLRHINDPEELARLYALSERLAARMRHRLARRERAQRRGGRLDLRRVIHHSVQSGMPLRLTYRRRRHKPPKLVAILDVSGSMNPYATFFVRFLRTVLGARWW